MLLNPKNEEAIYFLAKLKLSTSDFKQSKELNKRLSAQKGIKVEFQIIPDANHFFTKTNNSLIKYLDKYIKKETALY